MTRRIDWLPPALAMGAIGIAIGSDALRLAASLILTTGVVASLWARVALRRLTYRRVFGHSHLYAGEETTLAIHLDNDKPLPLIWVSADDRVPDALELRVQHSGKTRGPFDEPAMRSRPDDASPGRALPAAAEALQVRALRHTAYLGAYGQVTWRYTVECPARGWYRLGPVRLATSDPFGLYEVTVELRSPAWLIVYPAVRPLAALGFPPTDPFGGRRAHRPLVADPMRMAGVRDYRPEDSRRYVHWKASARRGELQVKRLEPVATVTTMLVVDMATMDPPWLGNLPERLEQVVAVAASIAHHAHEAGDALGIAINGSVPGTGLPIRVGPARGEAQLRRVLEALAAVGDFAHPVLPLLLAAESRRAPWGATLVVVTATETAHLCEELLRLRRAGRRVVLASLDDTAAGSLPGVLTYRLAPAQVEAVVFGRR